jgi:hypothetical protein
VRALGSLPASVMRVCRHARLAFLMAVRSAFRAVRCFLLFSGVGAWMVRWWRVCCLRVRRFSFGVSQRGWCFTLFSYLVIVCCRSCCSWMK